MASRFAVFVLCAAVLAGGVVCMAASDANAVRVADLRCEYRVDPMGIDVVRPRLSWRIEPADPAARGVRQTAYHIQVANSASELEADRSDLWDSGRVESDQSIQVAYAGKPLVSRTECHWRVRVWDEAGRPSDWSQPARWSMGLRKRADWTGQWIGVPTGSPDAGFDPWFRKTFVVHGRPDLATAYVASIGYHELYVNGKKVSDWVLAPSISELSKRVRYVTYDLTDALCEGPNAIVLWCSPGWANYAPFNVKLKPLVLAQLEIASTDGTTMTVATDAGWKTRPSPSAHCGGWQFWDYGGERYDANRETPDWGSPTLDDSGWSPVAVFTPKVELSADGVEPNRRITTLTPVEVKEQSPGVCRVDMGRNYSGWLEIRLKGRPGTTATLDFSERAELPKSYNQSSQYVFGPAGEGVFRHRFNYAAARWITITGLTAAPTKEDVRGYLISNDYPRIGRFECSDSTLNRIYEMALWTFRSLSLGGYTVDCPHRERLGYGGDAQADLETALMSFGIGAVYTKWLEDWRDVQRPDGDLPYTAPTYGGGGGPAWGGVCVTIPWQMYLHFGDRRVLETSYPMMQRWVAFLKSKTKDGLLRPWGGIWDFLGDWVPPGKGQEPGERVSDRSTLLFNNCYYVDNVRTVARIAELLGHKDQAAAYHKEAGTVADATQREFFDAKTDTYADGSQLDEALPLLMGVTPDALRPAVLRRLEREILVTKRGHVDTGIHGTYFLIKLLLNENRGDLVYEMVSQPDFPGWKTMLDQGATTLWEQWDGKNSLLHSSFTSIASWFIEGVAGIRIDPARPGYQHFFIRPQLVGDLTWAKGEYDSMYGKIVSRWKREKGRVTFVVEVPANTSATIYVPTDDVKSVTESGRPAAESRGVKFVKTVEHAAVYDVGSGRYTFEAPRSTP